MSQKIYNRIPTKIYKISGFIYELLPFLYIISGFLLLSGIQYISHSHRDYPVHSRNFYIVYEI